MNEKTALYYGHDPMCSFCWAFHPAWSQIKTELANQFPHIELVYTMGGLAPDSDQPMPEDLRQKLIATWRYIQQHIPGTRFNYDFWTSQQARRSTYPSCRAVMAIKILKPDLEDQMILTIQHAYYLNAQNPSNEDTLVKCAESIGLDATQFTETIRSQECDQAFAVDRELSAELGISSFPTLVLSRGNNRFRIPIDYNSASNVLDKLAEAQALLARTEFQPVS